MIGNVKRGWAAALLVALVGLVLVSGSVVQTLSSVGWDATIFVGFGEDDLATRAYAEDRLGDVILRGSHGHDGKYFFIQANDPWLLDPQEKKELLEAPLYRSQRMLYPALAGGFGLLGPEAIVWGLLVVNLLAIAAGSFATARIAQRQGASPWLGLAFALNIGFLYSIRVDGAGVVAAAAAFGAVALLLENRWMGTLVLLCAAALTREVMVLVAVGVAFWLWKEGRKKDAAVAVLLPVFVVYLWYAYSRFQLGADEGSVGAIGLPLVGLVKVVPLWLADPWDLVAGVAMILVLILFARRVHLTSGVVAWAFAGFVPLAALLSAKVWANYFDHMRVIAPVATALVLLMFAREPASVPLEERETIDAGGEVSVPIAGSPG